MSIIRHLLALVWCRTRWLLYVITPEKLQQQQQRSYVLYIFCSQRIGTL